MLNSNYKKGVTFMIALIYPQNESVVDIINKSQQGYSHIEEGRAELKIDDLIKLCRFYGVSADYFIGISGKK